MERRGQFGSGQAEMIGDARRYRRFKLDVKIGVYPRECPVVRGDTVDISESGISALLREEVPLGEVVRLEFTLPLGAVEILAIVRQRSAFRYGFQFVEADSAQQILGRTCAHLAVEQPDRGFEAPDHQS